MLRQYHHTDPPLLWVKLLAGSIAVHVLAILPVTGLMVIAHSTPPAKKTIAIDTVVLAQGRAVPVESAARKASPPAKRQPGTGGRSSAARTAIDPPAKATGQPTPNSTARPIAPTRQPSPNSPSIPQPDPPPTSGTETPTSQTPEPSPEPTNESQTPSAETEVVPADSGGDSPSPSAPPAPTNEVEGSPDAPATPTSEEQGGSSGGSNGGGNGVQATVLRSQAVSLGGKDEPEQIPVLQASGGSSISISFSPKAQQCQGQLNVRVEVEATGSGEMQSVSFNLNDPKEGALEAGHPCYELAREAISGLRFTPAVKDNAPVYGLLDVYIQVGNPNVG